MGSADLDWALSAAAADRDLWAVAEEFEAEPGRCNWNLQN